MSNDPFDAPATSEYLDFSTLVGELILFSPTEYIAKDEKEEKGIKTVNGLKDAVITNLVVLGKSGAASHDDVMILQGSLIAYLKKKALAGEGMVLGRLAKGVPAQKGWKAPYKLEVPTEADKQLARDYLASLKDDDPFAV
jgi:hypothetical protein